MKKVLIPILLMIFSLTFWACSKKIDLEITGPDEVTIGSEIVLECNYHENGDIKWSSSDDATALVVSSTNTRCIIKGVALGEVTIKATIKGNEATKTIKVVASQEEIIINGPNLMFVGFEFLFTCNQEVEWSSSDDEVLTIDNNGLSKALKEGEAYVIASIGVTTEKYLVKVYSFDFNLEIVCDKLLVVGEEKEFEVKGATDDMFVYVVVSSSNSSVLKIENNKVKALSEGKCTITADLNGKKASIEVEVVSDINKIRISGENVCRIDQVIFLSCNHDCVWSTSDDDIADILESGEIIPNGIGKCTIYATSKENPDNVASFELEIIGKTPRTITINNKNYVGLNQSVKLDITTFPQNASKRFVYESSNPFVASVSSDGVVHGLMEGEATITVYSFEDSNIYKSITICVTKPAPNSIKVNGNINMMQGEHNYLSLTLEGDNINENVVWESSDQKLAIVYDGIVLAVNKGTVKIRATSVIDKDIYGEIEINISQYVAPSSNPSDLEMVKKIIASMTLEQKVGQMFVVGFSGTEISSDLIKAIEKYHFGNVIYMGANCTDYTTLAKMSNDIQTKMITENGVGAFITTDQEGGTVARIKEGGTHFISNMAMGATNDYYNTYLEGVTCGLELRNYGINVDFAPVLDVNNNPDNPVIGVRSYSDNPLKVSLYGKNMYLGLASSNVMGTCKHFPGHGNTSTDSHYGLPTITTAMNELYQTELAPYISSIANGIDAIMTTHIIFTAIDEAYPATLSYKVLTELLREELGFDGVIFTDGMEMGAVTNNFGGYDKTGVLAIKAGADVLTYTTTSNPIKAYNGIMTALKSGELTEERINESLTRILLKKLKYGIISDPFAKGKDISDLLAEHEVLNNTFATSALTMVRGEFNGLDSNKRTLVISPTTSNSLGEGLNSNSLGAFVTKNLTDKGYDIEYVNVSNNITSKERTTVLSIIDNFDQIVLAFSNIKKNNYSNTISFVKEICALNKEVLVIGLDSPYDINAYKDSVKNYLNVYGYQKASVVAITRLLSGEAEANGVSSVELK